MKTKNHILKQNKGSVFPQRIIFLDTETIATQKTFDYEKHILKLGFAEYVSFHRKKLNSNVTDKIEFYDTETINKWILSKAGKKRRLIIMASNVWFDVKIISLDDYLIFNGYKCSRFYQQGLTTIISYIKEHYTIQFLSIQNFLKFSIEQIGKMLNLPKIKVDFDTIGNEDLMIYCKRDVEILRKSFLYWKQFCLDNDFGVFGITLPSQAFNSFRHKFMKNQIWIHTEEEPIKLERSSYFGGRTECFYIGKRRSKKTYKLDVNSLYPTVMKDNYFPTKLIHTIKSPTKAYILKLVENYCLIADVDIHLKKPFVPHRIDKRTCFPIGNFRASVCTETLKRLLQQNAIIKIYTANLYLKAKIFTDYINYFIQIKNKASIENNQFKRKIAKLFLNSLYGKFGQKQRKVIYEYKVDPLLQRNEIVYNADDNKSYHVVAYGGSETWTIAVDENSYNSMVAIASHVTDYARLFLWDTIRKLKTKSYYYCDTDSLFVNYQSFKKLKPYIHDTKLGFWKLEGTTRYLTIRNPKDYRFGKEKKIKGIRKNAKRVGKDRFKQVWFPSFKTTIKTKREEGYKIRYVTKQLSAKYLKGKIHKNGFTYPYHLSDFVL